MRRCCTVGGADNQSAEQPLPLSVRAVAAGAAAGGSRSMAALLLDPRAMRVHPASNRLRLRETEAAVRRRKRPARVNA